MGDVDPELTIFCNQAPNSKIGTSTQPQNLWPKICPAYKMLWGNSDTELVGVANQWLVLLDVQATRRRPCPTLPGWPGTKDWIAQTPRIEANTTGKKSIKWFPMIFCYTHRSLPSPTVIRKLSSINCWKQMQRPTAIQKQNLENEEESEEGL